MLQPIRFRNVIILLVGVCIFTISVFLFRYKQSLVTLQPQSAGNSTLGFQRIEVINLPHRYDREDAILMQSVASDIEYEIFPGVYAKDLQESGLPPVSKAMEDEGPKACLRAHANIWRLMLKEKWSSALILEADAAWDVEIRAIMQRVSYALNDLMDTHPLSTSETLATEKDPYNLAKWDIISLGHCHENNQNSDHYQIFSDPDSPVGKKYKEILLNDERVVRESGGPVCTTAYAISPTGALKLLLRTAIDFNRPVDLLIMDMVGDGTLISYSIHPPPFAQWKYEQHIGAENRNSDIQSSNANQDDKSDDAWKKVHQSMNVWRLGDNYLDSSFRHSAFGALKQMAFGG
ncbi:hypothetical protein NADFUDRAFT_47413 [Nadsonia fulvescens var. elongata DSM 6958]|uniref:Glycosyl transferase family 25 domain-containing protein n=1 Tax=Nadsonia fulvescens var. elongata DSM 6958 TaxID=857566 RepID=A0A1E3PH00_9ASCO|nr:hypothetical protein NADFUDRAFT_47413 [Nadsonia fulvescens var. elongata DSM 6958]